MNALANLVYNLRYGRRSNPSYSNWHYTQAILELYRSQRGHDEREKTSPAELDILDDDELRRTFWTTATCTTIIESILFWENTVNSIAFLLLFHIIFWSFVIVEFRGFAAAGSAALLVVFGYSSLEARIRSEAKKSRSIGSPRKAEKLDKIVQRAKSTFNALKLFRKDHPGVFCAGVCTFSIALWLIGNAINGILLTYLLCMTILVGPALFLRIPRGIFSTRALYHRYTVEWYNEIEEFLPAVTEDNLEVLQRASDTGEHSSTPQGAILENQIDPLNDEELAGLKMPSHEEGSTDGLDVSELELSTEENDADSMKMQSEHFEPGSSSEEEADLEPVSRKLPSHSDDESDSEFEIIDSREIANLDDV